jgi:dUTP pyrophosphatase
MEILVKRLDPDVSLPARAHLGDAGLDVYASEDVSLKPGERTSVGTGIAVAIPEGYAAFVLPRSGLAAKHGISLVNAPGLIDSGYRGEVRVLLINLDRDEAVTLRRGERIAQLVVQHVEDVTLKEVDELPSSARGEGGFGSTGR